MDILMHRLLTVYALATILCGVGCVGCVGARSTPVVTDSDGATVRSDAANLLAKIEELHTDVDAAIDTTITATAAVEAQVTTEIAALSSKISQTISQTAGRDSKSYIGDSWSNRIAIVLLGAIPLLGVPVCFIIYARLKTNPLGRRVLYGKSECGHTATPPPLFANPLPPPD